MKVVSAAMALKNLAIIAVLVAVAAAGWVIWNNMQQSSPADSYQECRDAEGSSILESYPERCLTKDGKSFTNPERRTFQPPSEGALPAQQ